MEREPNTIYALSLSYGKDSLACLGAIEKLGLPLDRIIHSEVWATDTIHADLPPMVEFKAKADKIIKERWGMEVEHISAPKSFEGYFYDTVKTTGERYGFPVRIVQWCTSRLKTDVLAKSRRKDNGKKIVSYLGIAVDEPERIARHEKKDDIILPLVLAGWDEPYCRKWCEERDLLSPIYTTATRGGCWFCHNQGVEQLRLLRKNYPDLWALLMKWDLDSPTTFKADGHTVHDYDKRFQMEDEGIIKADEPFFWKYLEKPPMRQLDFFDKITR